MNLAAMMRLVIEEMRDQDPSWFADFAACGAGVPGEVFAEPVLAEAVRPGHDGMVEFGARALKAVSRREVPAAS